MLQTCFITLTHTFVYNLCTPVFFFHSTAQLLLRIMNVVNENQSYDLIRVKKSKMIELKKIN